MSGYWSWVNWQQRSILFLPLIALLLLGLVMVTTSSSNIAVHYGKEPWHFMVRQGIYIVVGMLALYGISQVSLQTWQRFHVHLWVVAVIGLVLVLIPGVGHEVNGSRRWLNFGVFKLQVSEVAKLVSVLYIASFLIRRQGEVVQSWKGFFIPLSITSLLLGLLLFEPDFGAAFVLLGAVLVQLFMGGVKVGQYILLILAFLILGSLALTAESYRVERLMAYLDPWAPENVYDIGYQLTQSLIAFGRGGIWGIGLGESVQKLFYLPEAHTDFVFAIWAEETGLIGAYIALALLAWLIINVFRIAQQSYQHNQMFACYVAIGIATLLSLQVVVNVGVNTGLLPTKGLTLPFYSYGGSSLLMCCVMVAVVMRIEQENSEVIHD